MPAKSKSKGVVSSTMQGAEDIYNESKKIVDQTIDSIQDELKGTKQKPRSTARSTSSRAGTKARSTSSRASTKARSTSSRAGSKARSTSTRASAKTSSKPSARKTSRPTSMQKAQSSRSALEQGMSRAELYERARKMNIPGRSNMTKRQLASAVSKKR